METFIEKLKERIKEESDKSLKNISGYRNCGAFDSEKISTGEVIAFDIVIDIIKELEKENNE